MKANPLPPHWGDDGLSGFLELAHQNRLATYMRNREWCRCLADIDTCFATISKGWISPQSEVAAFLLLWCHGAYRTACGAALAGQTVEQEPGRATLQRTLHQGDGLAVDHALESTAQVGVCCLDILECAFRARFELLGVRHVPIELLKGL